MVCHFERAVDLPLVGAYFVRRGRHKRLYPLCKALSRRHRRGLGRRKAALELLQVRREQRAHACKRGGRQRDGVAVVDGGK
jgi:hypothetical protein